MDSKVRQIPAAVVAVVSLLFPALQATAGLPVFRQAGNILVMSNANVLIQYNLSGGTADFYWQNSKKISAFYSGVVLGTGYVTGTNYTSWSWAVVSSNQIAVIATGNGNPTMKQYFTLDQDNSFLTSVEMDGFGLSANWMAPVVVDTPGGVDLGSYNDNRALFVPFDNDQFVRYSAESLNGSDTGNEVGAFYDNSTRNGLVVGSVTHDTWKTGVFWSGSNNKLDQLKVYGGVTNHWTWDVMLHGSIHGNTISSPTDFVGFGSDWRATMEAFADENALFAPKLPWTNGTPFGWNSWGFYQTTISYASAIAVSDSIHTNLQPYNFNNNGTVYVNLDSYWNNLWTDYSGSQLQSFVAHCHANGQKTGIYFTPFAFWGNANDATNYWVPVGYPPNYSLYRYSDILLRDGNGQFIPDDKAYAVDPTHPGTRGMIDYYVYWFTNWGFDYVKLDFLSHGSLEGVHYDTNVMTGIQAYNQGMQYLLNAIHSRMFLSESIAPLFPYQYGHSRRIACDAQSSGISDTEYTMNSVSYGWWLDRLYSFNDPDIMDFGTGPDINENQSRVISGAVTSGIFLDGDSLTNSASISAAQTSLTNAAINAVARVGQTFRLVEGNTGSSASDILVRQDGTNWCLAVFNYSSSATNKTVDLNRAGIPPGTYYATNLWDGTSSIASGFMNVSLNAKQSKLFKLALVRGPADLKWVSTSSAAWDVNVSSNWLNFGTSALDQFYPGDSVLFDDTAGVATGITIGAGVAVTPTVLTNNSSVNNFTIGGAGKISSTASIVKLGSSTLTLSTSNDFSGGTTVNAGTMRAGNNSAFGTGSLTVNSGGTLDVNTYQLGSLPVTIAGAGVGGNGAIINSTGSQNYALEYVTLNGNSTIGGAGRWDLRANPAAALNCASGQPCNLTKVGANFIGIVSVSVDPNLANIDIQGGTLDYEGNTTGLGNPTNAVTIRHNAILEFWNATNPLNKWVVLLDGGRDFNGSGANALIGPVTLSTNAAGAAGNCTFNIAGASQAISNAISGPGNLIKTGASSLYLAGANTYTGNTLVNAGTLAVVAPGSISVASGATISGLGGTTFALTNATLQLAVAPGTTNAIVAVLSVGGAANTINIGVLPSVPTYPATYHLIGYTNLSGTFNFVLGGIAGGYSGYVSNNAGSHLVDLVVTNRASPPRPSINTFTLSGTNLMFSGNGTLTNAANTYHVLASTNVALPLTNWTTVATQQFDLTGNFAFTNRGGTNGQQFYLLKVNWP